MPPSHQLVVKLGSDALHQLVVLPVEREPGRLEGDLEQRLHGVVGQLVHVKNPAG